jgi:arsenate reductase
MAASFGFADMTDPFPITVFHNPACGTSRNTVEMVRAAGYEPTVVEYLSAGWRADQLRGLMAAASVRPRDWLREKGTPAAELGLLAADVRDNALIEAMVAHPILVNRPVVVTPKGVRLCRPSEAVFALLERGPDRFIKEDGEVVTPGV